MLGIRSHDSSKLDISDMPVNLELKLVAIVRALCIANLNSGKSKKIEGKGLTVVPLCYLVFFPCFTSVQELAMSPGLTITLSIFTIPFVFYSFLHFQQPS
jgi:hypothetical protein